MEKKRWFFALRKLVKNIFTGTFPSIKKGTGGIEFAGYREFQPGDSSRDISYLQSLKHHRYYVRENVVEKGAVCLFVIDRSASVKFGPSGVSKKEIEDRILAVLAPALARNNNKVGFIVATEKPEIYLEPKFGEKAAIERLSLISCYSPRSKKTDLNAVFRAILQMNIRADLIFILSDFYTKIDFVNSLGILSRKYDVIPMLLKDPFETTSFPNTKGGMIAFRDLETGDFFWGDEPQKISNKKLFKQLGLDYVLLKTDQNEKDWIQKLMIVFEQRKKRRRMIR